MVKALLSFQITVVVLAGIGIGAAGYHVADKAAEATALAQQCQANQNGLTKELNERILPEIQKQLASVQSQQKVAKK